MRLQNRLFLWNRERRGRPIRPMQVIALAFAGIILLGAWLLTLPAASRSGGRCPWLKALFTATSATCVTGLTPFDTWSQWSPFGQGVLLCLIEVGGLGFMSMATLFIFLLRKRVSLKQRMVMAQALSLNGMEGVVRLQRTVLFGSLSVEGLGALILTLYFWPRFGFSKALWLGIFHAVSAFCNAGFDVFGFLEPGSSLMQFQDDPVVLLTLGALVIVGGLGFLVWEELAERKPFSRMSVYSRLVLCTTLGLLISGWAVMCLLEWNNPGTLGGMPVWEKLLNGFFQSVTLRTAGFAAIDQGALTDGQGGRYALYAHRRLLRLYGRRPQNRHLCGADAVPLGAAAGEELGLRLSPDHPGQPGAGCHDHCHDHGAAGLFRGGLHLRHVAGVLCECPV